MGLVTITIPVEDFKSMMTNIIRTEVNLFKRQFLKNQNSDLLTRKETAALLKIDLSTLWEWSRGESPKLKAHGFGTRRVYYKKSEIPTSLIRKN